jgi:hypothetical protein
VSNREEQAMSNLTFDEMLIRQHKAEPLEGHTVVVLERVGEEGEKFHSVLEPGAERPRQGLISYLLGKPNVYFAFAVNASKSRLLSFTENVEMAERAHDFELHFSLWYRVADPQLLVSVRESDPLGTVRRKVAEVVTEEIAERSWSEVWDSFRVAGESVVSSTLAELKAFARDYGISITSLRLRPKFSASAREIDREIHKVQEQGRLERVQLKVARDRQNQEIDLRRENAERDDLDRADAARRKHEDTVASAVTEKVAEIIRGAGGVVDLHDLQITLGEAGMLGGGPQNGTARIGSGNGSAPHTITAGSVGLPAVLSDLTSLTQQVRPDGTCRLVRSFLLHLVAEMVADDSLQVSEEQARYARLARAEIDAASHLSADQLEALQNLADPQRLHRRLYP